MSIKYVQSLSFCVSPPSFFDLYPTRFPFLLPLPILILAASPPVTMYQFHQDQTTYIILQAEKKLKSKSWVMTTPGSEGFIKLPNEQILYTSPPRTSIQISTPNTYPAAQPYSAKSDSGIVYVTNQRVIRCKTQR
jgi:hypothetical protein